MHRHSDTDALVLAMLRRTNDGSDVRDRPTVPRHAAIFSEVGLIDLIEHVTCTKCTSRCIKLANKLNKYILH